VKSKGERVVTGRRRYQSRTAPPPGPSVDGPQLTTFEVPLHPASSISERYL